MSLQDEENVSRANALCQLLGSEPTDAYLEEAAELLFELRNQRQFSLLCDLAEWVCRYRDMPTAWCWYGQGLIETGRLRLAASLLQVAREKFASQLDALSEVEGLLGRTYKQLCADTPAGVDAQGFLDAAMEAYGAPYLRDGVGSYWHGINLAALARLAKRRGLRTAREAADLAREVLQALEQVPQAKRDGWWDATRAEAFAALGSWAEAEQALVSYLAAPRLTPFQVAGTLRQWRDVWRVQDEGPEGVQLIQTLEARLMSWGTPAGAVVSMDGEHVRQMRASGGDAAAENLQKLTGSQGRETIAFYRKGLVRAGSVAAVREELGLRFGTGFAVRAGDFGVLPADEVLLLTNHHVLNSAGFGAAGNFDHIEIVFDAAEDGPLKFGVDRVVAESPVLDGLDYALVRLLGDGPWPEPVEMPRRHAALSAQSRVYVIGYPQGDAMQFSMHDNLLIDHECDPGGKPPLPERRRLQYSASTEEGSSGSPVFDGYWNCIGLHHAGGKRDPRKNQYGIQALNGSNRMIDANQGIWIGSIQAHIQAQKLNMGSRS